MEAHRSVPGTMETVCLSTEGHTVKQKKKVFHWEGSSVVISQGRDHVCLVYNWISSVTTWVNDPFPGITVQMLDIQCSDELRKEIWRFLELPYRIVVKIKWCHGLSETQRVKCLKQKKILLTILNTVKCSTNICCYYNYYSWRLHSIPTIMINY